jgi:hypothetical protein
MSDRSKECERVKLSVVSVAATNLHFMAPPPEAEPILVVVVIWPEIVVVAGCNSGTVDWMWFCNGMMVG